MSKQQLDLSTITMAQLAAMGEDALYDVATSLFAHIKSNVYDDTTLKQVVTRQGKTLNEVLAMKDVLSKLERGAIEEAVLTVLQDSKLQDIYANMTITINGTPYSLQSWAEVMANVKVDKNHEVLRTNGKISGVKVTWDDESTTEFGLVSELNADETVRTDVYTGTMNGVEYTKTDTFTVGARTTGDNGEIPVPFSNLVNAGKIVIDFTSSMTSPIETESNEDIADLNDDDLVGKTADTAPIFVSLADGGFYDRGEHQVEIEYPEGEGVQGYQVMVTGIAPLPNGDTSIQRFVSVEEGSLEYKGTETLNLNFADATTPIFLTARAVNSLGNPLSEYRNISIMWSGSDI